VQEHYFTPVPWKTQDSYQGATSVVPQLAEMAFGFSRWVDFSPQFQGSPLHSAEIQKFVKHD
jgi:hypothetical protein